MAIVRPGIGATITQNTLEGQLGHAFWLLKEYQASPIHNPAELDYVQWGIDPTSLKFTGSFSFPCTRELIDAKPAFTIRNYLENVPFSAGNPIGTFGNSTLPAYFLEVFTVMQVIEGIYQANPTEINNISGTYDTDTLIFSGELALPINPIMNSDGVLIIYFNQYLNHIV